MSLLGQTLPLLDGEVAKLSYGGLAAWFTVRPARWPGTVTSAYAAGR
jgi:hypothetical protein